MNNRMPPTIAPKTLVIGKSATASGTPMKTAAFVLALSMLAGALTTLSNPIMNESLREIPLGAAT
jgi:hypothetical protein